MADRAKLVADDFGTYVDADEAASELLGYSRTELIGMTIWDLTPGAQVTDGLALWQQFVKRGHDAGLFRLRKKNGEEIDVAYEALANVEPGRHVSYLREVPTGLKPPKLR